MDDIIYFMRKTPFVNGEIYHVFNRGVDKRNIFINKYDLERFFQSMSQFNRIEPIGSIYENRFVKQKYQLGCPTTKLVNFICYCINLNHFHFMLEQVSDNGISEFMKRMGGYTRYFNEKHQRTGFLFQGKFKSIHIDSNEYLLHLSAYVNLNNRVHKIKNENPLFKNRSSWEEYININNNNFCKKDLILGQFKNKKEYKKFAEDSLQDILDKKNEEEIKDLLLE